MSGVDCLTFWNNVLGEQFTVLCGSSTWEVCVQSSYLFALAYNLQWQCNLSVETGGVTEEGGRTAPGDTIQG